MKILNESSPGNMVEEKIKKQDLPVIEFNTGNKLVIDKYNQEIRLLDKNQSVQLTISVKENSLTLNINATQLNINATEELNLKSKKINIEGEHQINIKTAGNLVQQISKDSLIEVGGTNKLIAQVQKITATLGNVDIKANDDVRLDGERIKLNCD